MLGHHALGEQPLATIDPDESQAEILPYTSAQEEAAVELVFVIEVDVIAPTAA